MNRAWMLLVLAVLAMPAPGQEDERETDPLYRVEAIAFLHTGGASDARRVESLRSFDAFADARRLARDAGHLRQALALMARMHPLAARPLPGDAGALQAWTVPESFSPPMTRARQRLADSPQYEHVAAHAWIQPAARATPWIRFHDDQVIAEVWPEIESPQPVEIADEEIDDGANGVAPEPPRPELFHRLDGGIRVVQRQYLHLEVDLEWREPAVPLAGSELSTTAPEWLVHRLKTSRNIRPGRLEYFDSEWVGLIVRVEEIEMPGEE